MDSGLVTALSGALANARRVDIISNNLANADTVAFKGDDLAFEETLTEAQRQESAKDIPERPATDRELYSKHGQEVRPVLHGAEFTEMREGAFRQTQNPLDVAIQGNGFFEVLTPQGIRLTRSGNFTLDASRRLVTRDGFLVLGAGQQANPAQRAIILSDHAPNIDMEGNIYGSAAEGNPLIGRLSVVQVANPSALKKAGSNMFEASSEAVLLPVGGAARNIASLENAQFKENPLGPINQVPRLHQGMLESSNVNAVLQMTKLIQAQRAFDQNLKVIENVNTLNGRVSDLSKF